MNRVQLILNQKKIAEMSEDLNRHMKKRCAYCDLDLGLGYDIQVMEFLEHIELNHLEVLEPDKLRAYKGLLLKFQ